VVPAASNSLITLLNVQQLLEGTRAGQEGGWMGDAGERKEGGAQEGRDQPAHARRCGRSLIWCSFVCLHFHTPFPPQRGGLSRQRTWRRAAQRNRPRCS
jgi:hypothetical protein